ncbi:MAG: ScyD/ScyE family protein [Gemmatimonadaceae bacterium]
MARSSHIPPPRAARRLAGCLSALAITAALSACDSAREPTAPATAAPVSAAKAPPRLATVSVFASGLNNPRGLRWGPDNNLYVAEAGAGGTTSTVGQCEQVPSPVGPYLGGHSAQITKISDDGAKSVVASGLPSTVNAMGFVSGISSVEFVGKTLYALVDGAGCSHGHTDMPNSVIRVAANGTWSRVADLSQYYHANPTANMNADDFEPDGTPFSMLAVRGDLYVVEPNHGSLDRVRLDGTISRVADISAAMGHIVPTTVSYHGNFFVGNLGTFPVVPGREVELKINPAGKIKTWATGLTSVLGSEWDGRGRLYVLEAMTAPGNPTPLTGKIVRIDPSGSSVVIADGLFFPTAMTMGPDGNLYVSNYGFGPPPIGLGQILKIDLH